VRRLQLATSGMRTFAKFAILDLEDATGLLKISSTVRPLIRFARTLEQRTN